MTSSKNKFTLAVKKIRNDYSYKTRPWHKRQGNASTAAKILLHSTFQANMHADTLHMCLCHAAESECVSKHGGLVWQSCLRACWCKTRMAWLWVKTMGVWLGWDFTSDFIPDTDVVWQLPPKPCQPGTGEEKWTDCDEVKGSTNPDFGGLNHFNFYNQR